MTRRRPGRKSAACATTSARCSTGSSPSTPTPIAAWKFARWPAAIRLATKPEYHDAVRGFVKSLKPPLKLSLQALETLAVIAYKQPVTAPEISEIRGVESGGVLGTLMARKLIGTAGRKAVIGRPMLYKTTKEFLVRFGLKDINELPSIEEFEKMAGELAEPVQEEMPMDEAGRESVESVELISGDGSPVLDELNSAPATDHRKRKPGGHDERQAQHTRRRGCRAFIGRERRCSAGGREDGQRS